MSAKLPDTVPLHAQNLLDFIGDIEAPQGYDTIFGNRQANLPVPLTQMTYGEIVDAQGNWGNKTWVRANWGHKTASSAAGRYQFMRKTLQDIAKAVGSIDGRTIFSPSLQDRLGYFLLLRRGYADFIAGRISLVQFGLNLAREWASFPVLSATKGEHRDVARGQSYYAGDGLNKSLVKPEQVEQRLRHVRELAALMTEADTTATISPKPSAAGRGGGGASVAPVENADPEKLDGPKAKPVRKSGRFWTWLLAGGISSTTITEKLGAFQLDWRVQIALLAVIVGFAAYAIATMPAVRRALGIGDA
jgi:muramidase (phage lysozyme)